MKKLNPIYNSIFYILSSVSLLTNSFINFGTYIFDRPFNDSGTENKTIIVFLIISSLFIAFSFALSIYEIYKFIKKEKIYKFIKKERAADTFNYFTIGYFITILSYTITSYYFTSSVYYGIVLFIILSLLIALPFLIKLFDKKDFIDIPFWIYTISYLAMLIFIVCFGIVIAIKGFSLDLEKSLSGAEISYLIGGIIGLIASIYTLFYLPYKRFSDYSNKRN